jgi:hypothetical protein
MAATTIRGAAHEYAALLENFANDVVSAALIITGVGETRFTSPEVERKFAALLGNAGVDMRRKWRLAELGQSIVENARQFAERAREAAQGEHDEQS